jgi:ATP-binding cassette subfamily G (WHITE) protein 2 (SNQ2)
MLDMIGAGATALSDTDWHQVWLGSKEHEILLAEIEEIHSRGRNRPRAEATLHTEFANSWARQTLKLFRRDLIDKWRNPTYLMAKLTLNIIAGLFIG